PCYKLCSDIAPTRPRSTLFPYTTLFRSIVQDAGHILLDTIERSRHRESRDRHTAGVRLDHGETEGVREAREHQHIRRRQAVHELDRKSTRLNSSHRTTSYAVFCLKKKKT